MEPLHPYVDFIDSENSEVSKNYPIVEQLT